MTQDFPISKLLQPSRWIGLINTIILNREIDLLRVYCNWGKTQILKSLTTLFKKAEAVHATPQDLSTVLRRAGGMCFFAGSATLDRAGPHHRYRG